MTTVRNAQIGAKQHLTSKQKEVLVKAYKALAVNTVGTPDPEALSGPGLVVLENKGLACRYEVEQNPTTGKQRTLFRLTALGLQLGKTAYEAGNP